MTNSYEFLSYQAFPEDPYISEVVEVLLHVKGDKEEFDIILPCGHMKKKDGGTFWNFLGCGVQHNGVKKRFNGMIDSRVAKMRFENDLNAYIATYGVKQPEGQVNHDSGVAGPQSANLGASKENAPFQYGETKDGPLPF